jgi:hypothetical protein
MASRRGLASKEWRVFLRGKVNSMTKQRFTPEFADEAVRLAPDAA